MIRHSYPSQWECGIFKTGTQYVEAPQVVVKEGHLRPRERQAQRTEASNSAILFFNRVATCSPEWDNSLFEKLSHTLQVIFRL